MDIPDFIEGIEAEARALYVFPLKGLQQDQLIKTSESLLGNSVSTRQGVRGLISER